MVRSTKVIWKYFFFKEIKRISWIRLIFQTIEGAKSLGEHW